MCGSIGWLSTRGKISDPRAVEPGVTRALESLKHRWPCSIISGIAWCTFCATAVPPPKCPSSSKGSSPANAACPAVSILRGAGGKVQQPRLVAPGLQVAGEEDEPPAAAKVEIMIVRQVVNRHILHQSCYLWSKSALANYILTVLGDRMEMAHSVEGRLPFLDHHLVELAVRMPVHVKLNGLVEKYILREASREVITDTVYKRSKHIFSSPPSALHGRGKLFDFFQDTISSIDATSLPVFQKEALLGQLSRMPAMDATEQRHCENMMNKVVSTVLLHRHFIE